MIIFLVIINLTHVLAQQLVDKSCQSGLREDNTNYIYCARQNLFQIPRFFSSSSLTNIVYDELVLSDNLIEQIRNDSFSLSFKVRKLYLDNNPLRYIHSKAFDHLRNYLEELYLEFKKSTNEMEYDESGETGELSDTGDTSLFEASIFQKCFNLKVLSLKSYKISQFKGNMFVKMNKLETLQISNNRIKQLDDAAFVGLEQSLTSLNLDSNYLEWIPSRALERLRRLKRLSLSQNRVRLLHSNAFFYLNNLISLDLSYNYLNKFDENAFNGPVQNSLRLLQLQNNELKWAHFIHILYNLHVLQELNLDFNKLGLSKLNQANKQDDEENLLAMNQNSSFIYLQLNALSLQGNGLTDENLNMFYNSHDYDILLLKQNESSTSFSSQLKQTFNQNNRKQFKYVNLNKLNLARNKLTAIENDFFMRTNMTNLKHLSLEKNPLNENANEIRFYGLEKSLNVLNLNQVGFNLFSLESLNNLENLENLKLNANSKKSISKKQTQTNNGSAKTKLSNLRSLELQNNNLNELPDYLCDLKSLNDLDLSSNSLTSLNLNCLLFKQDLSVNLKQLNLNNNPLKCDCNLRKLKIWLMRNYDKELLDLIRWQCSDPNDLNGRYFANLELNELNCPLTTLVTKTTKTTTQFASPTTTSTPISTTLISSTTLIPTLTTARSSKASLITNNITANKFIILNAKKEMSPVFELDNFSLLLVAIAFGLLFVCLLILIMFYMTCIRCNSNRDIDKYEHNRFCSPTSSINSSSTNTVKFKSNNNDSFSRNSQLTLLSSEILLKVNKPPIITDNECYSYNYYEKNDEYSSFKYQPKNQQQQQLQQQSSEIENHIYHEINTPVKYLAPSFTNLANIQNAYESPYFVYPYEFNSRSNSSSNSSNKYLTNGLIV